MNYLNKILSILLFSFTLWASDEESYMHMTAFSIGQGNCVAIKTFEADKGSTDYYLVDGGSRAYKDDQACQDYFRKKYTAGVVDGVQDQKAKDQTTGKKRESTSTPVTPGCQKHKYTMRHSRTAKDEQIIVDALIAKVRQGLGAMGAHDPIHVKTIFVSHPDEDHYNWIQRFFRDGDEIDHMILGGLPEKYAMGFQGWIDRQAAKGVSVFFPAIHCDQPIEDMESLLEVSKKRLYANHFFSDPKNGWIQERASHLEGFGEALPWGKEIKAHVLTLNPTHFEEKGTILRHCHPRDTNADSMVIRFSIGGNAVILTGDATKETTDRVRQNYEDTPGFFNTHTVLMADHHGSSSHDSNDKDWIRTVKPAHVICSAGTIHRHPTGQAYENFKLSTELKFFHSPHDIWVYEKSGKGQKAQPVCHKTHASIFSTFNSSDIRVTMHGKGLPIIHTVFNDFFHQKAPLQYAVDHRKDDKKKTLDWTEKDLEFISTLRGLALDEDTRPKPRHIPFTSPDQLGKRPSFLVQEVSSSKATCIESSSF